MKLTATSLVRTAYHEAGHAVLAHMSGLRVLGISIERDDDSFGRMFYTHDAPRLGAGQASNARACRRVEAYVVCYLGGAEAERRFAGRRDRDGASADLQEAMDAAARLVLCEEELNACLRWLAVRARYLVVVYWPLIDGLARRLLRSPTMTAHQVQQAIRELARLRRRRRVSALVAARRR
jgi:ATP-dependent Zn protease